MRIIAIIFTVLLLNGCTADSAKRTTITGDIQTGMTVSKGR